VPEMSGAVYLGIYGNQRDQRALVRECMSQGELSYIILVNLRVVWIGGFAMGYPRAYTPQG